MPVTMYRVGRSLGRIPFHIALCCCLGTSGCLRPPPDIREHLDAAGHVDAIQFTGPHVLNKDLVQLADHPDVKIVKILECSQVTDKGLLYLENTLEVEQLSLVRVPITDAGLAPLARLVNLADLNLTETSVKGIGLSQVASTKLRKLTVFGPAVTAEGMSTLASLSNLQELELNCQDISLVDMPYLAKLSNLETLHSNQTPVGEGGLESLRGLTRLRILKLSSPDVSDASIGAMNTLESLEEVEISRAVITNEGLASLALPKLKWLSINGCRGITDAGLANLAGMPELEVLMATQSGISGEDFTGLRVVPKLREIYIFGSQFKGNDESIQRLKEILPNCEVVIQDG